MAWILEIPVFSALLCWLFSAGELIHPGRQTRNRVLAAVYVNLSIMLVHGWLMITQRFELLPRFFLLHLPAIFLIGPLLRAYLLLSLDRNAPAISRLWRHAAVVAAVFLFMAPFFLENDAERLSRIRDFQNAKLAIYPGILFPLGVLHLFVYVLVSFREIRVISPRTLLNEPTIRVVFLLLVVSISAGALALYAFATRQPAGYRAAILFLASVPPILFLTQKRYPAFFSDLQAVAQRERYLRSTLRSVDTSEIGQKLDRLMSEDKLYRNEELQLADLAQQLDVSAHQLSEYLNTVKGENFAAYVNGYRIREAGDLLLKDPDRTVLSIAYEVGFNSKSSFHTAFARKMGMTPLRFRRGAGKSPK